MWAAITQVTTGFTLIAFIVAVTACVYRARLLYQARLIESAPLSERTSLVERALDLGRRRDSTAVRSRLRFVALGVLPSSPIPTSMFVHAVYFWLRNDLTAAEVKQFDAGVAALRSIEVVYAGYVGVPAATNRPIIERGYTRALVLVFKDEKAHDAYQVHPVHDRFRAECSPLWTKVQIFDSVGDE